MHIKLHMPAGFHAFIVPYCFGVHTPYTSRDFLLFTSTLKISKDVKGFHVLKGVFQISNMFPIEKKNSYDCLIVCKRLSQEDTAETKYVDVRHLFV